MRLYSLKWVRPRPARIIDKIRDKRKRKRRIRDRRKRKIIDRRRRLLEYQYEFLNSSNKCFKEDILAT